MSTETTNKKIKIDNGTTFGKTYTDKAVDERLQGLVSTATFTPVKEKANNSLQKPAGLTKTELVGVGTNGQENIEIGDNLTLENGKLSATGGGGSGGDVFDIIKLSDDGTTYTGTITGTKPVLIDNNYGSKILYSQLFGKPGGSTQVVLTTFNSSAINYEEDEYINGQVNRTIESVLYYHFITMTDSASNVVLYLTTQDGRKSMHNAYSLASYFSGKKVLANGNLHGVVPTYISGEGGVIKIYYRTPGDSNINPTPDEYQDLSSFTITDLVSPVE